MNFFSIMGAIIAAGIGATAFFFRKGGIYNPHEPISDPVEPPKTPQDATLPPAPAPQLLWDTTANIKHSIRVICDDEGLDLEQKNTLCATIGGESQYNTKAVRRNYYVQNGKQVLGSTDWGLCQWNDYYHGKEISGGFDGEAMNNPEKAVRLMCQYWKRGQRNLWVAYKNGSYKAYL
jgi:hypothetical protein